MCVQYHIFISRHFSDFEIVVSFHLLRPRWIMIPHLNNNPTFVIFHVFHDDFSLDFMQNSVESFGRFLPHSISSHSRFFFLSFKIVNWQSIFKFYFFYAHLILLRLPYTSASNVVTLETPILTETIYQMECIVHEFEFKKTTAMGFKYCAECFAYTNRI